MTTNWIINFFIYSLNIKMKQHFFCKYILSTTWYLEAVYFFKLWPKNSHGDTLKKCFVKKSHFLSCQPIRKQCTVFWIGIDFCALTSWWLILTLRKKVTSYQNTSLACHHVLFSGHNFKIKSFKKSSGAQFVLIKQINPLGNEWCLMTFSYLKLLPITDIEISNEQKFELLICHGQIHSLQENSLKSIHFWNFWLAWNGSGRKYHVFIQWRLCKHCFKNKSNFNNLIYFYETYFWYSIFILKNEWLGN